MNSQNPNITKKTKLKPNSNSNNPNYKKPKTAGFVASKTNNQNEIKKATPSKFKKRVVKKDLNNQNPNNLKPNINNEQFLENNDLSGVRDVQDEKSLVTTSRNTTMKISGVLAKNKFEYEWRQKNRNLVKKSAIPTKIYALGGIEEIGKNMYCIEHDDEILIIDCGIKFANKKELPGISGIIPSFSYLKENEHKVKALIITHGHEDHIGGVAYLLKMINIPKIYSPVIAAELIKRKALEHKIMLNEKIELFSDDSVFHTKHFIIDFYRVNHSIPDSFGLAVASPNGLIATSGDFRFDFASHSDKTNLNKISKISSRGIDVLLCESTNSEQDAFNESEENVIKELNNIISSATGRVIITSFASNLGRVEEIIRIATQRGRKTVILGRSMDANIAASRKVGYLKFDEKYLLAPRDIASVPKKNILIICTGSQGEENAALNTIARGKHPWIILEPDDTVILSSNAIPGNFLSVEAVVNKLYKAGVNVYVNSPYLKIHSSGHAGKLEQQLFIDAMNPRFLVPIHGEYKMLRKLQKNCHEIGLVKEKVLIVSNGQVLHLLNKDLKISEEIVDASEVYIDSHDVTLKGNDVVRERFELGEKGMVVASIFISMKEKKIFSIAPIATAGSFYAFDSIDFFKYINNSLRIKIQEYFKKTEQPNKKELQAICLSLLTHLVWKFKNKKPKIKVLIYDQSLEELFDKKIAINKKVKQEEEKIQAVK